jgi:hypothetical protein
MSLYDDYKGRFHKDVTIQDYSTEAEAVSVAQSLGGDGFHSHTREDGLVTYMPFATHLEYEQAVGSVDPQQEEFKTEINEKLQARLMQLISSSSSDNSL